LFNSSEFFHYFSSYFTFSHQICKNRGRRSREKEKIERKVMCDNKAKIPDMYEYGCLWVPEGKDKLIEMVNLDDEA
jgi:hypothetical protein